MPSLLLELLERFDGSLRLVLGQPTRRPKPRLALDQGTTPELSAVRALSG